MVVFLPFFLSLFCFCIVEGIHLSDNRRRLSQARRGCQRNVFRIPQQSKGGTDKSTRFRLRDCCEGIHEKSPEDTAGLGAQYPNKRTSTESRRGTFLLSLCLMLFFFQTVKMLFL